MEVQSLPSKLLESAVQEMSSLPSVGRKTALRLVLHLLKQPREQVERFGMSFITLRNEVKKCRVCGNISDSDTCRICSNPRRDHSTVCVVESIKDVMSIEGTGQYSGVYHVLGGIISPIDGVGPSDLTFDELVARVATGNVKEVIVALSTTMEGETTAYYLYKKLHERSVQISALARGVGFGDELEYTDEITLGRSIKNRTPFENIFGSRQ
ncbi:MAG: recombination mediator RecR [Prevotellaceae bacterium]|jgi:recombination protein RecR|nr:recombination mediator RecR [Prevotellaceae bacterium]